MPVARMKPSSPRVSSPSPPSHKLELQTLKLEELTVSLVCSVPGLALFRAGTRFHKLKASALGKLVWIVVPPLDFLVIPPQSSLSTTSPNPYSGLRAQAAAAPAGTPGVRDQSYAPGAHAWWHPAQRTAEAPARGQRGRCSLAASQVQDAWNYQATRHGEGGLCTHGPIKRREREIWKISQ